VDKIALTSEHMAGFGKVPFSELTGQLTKKQKDRRIAIKPKSADNYVGRPNKIICKNKKTFLLSLLAYNELYEMFSYLGVRRAWTVGLQSDFLLTQCRPPIIARMNELLQRWLMAL